MKKKYIILIIITLLLILIGGYLVYKIYYSNYYDLKHIQDFEKSKQNFNIINENITIKTEILNGEEYLIFKNIKIKNEFKEFKKTSSSDDNPNIKSEEFVWYTLNDDNSNRQLVAIGIAKGPTLVDLYKSEVYLSSDIRVKESNDRTKLFNDNNITNDIELIKYIENTKDDKQNIFNSIKDMKSFYEIHSLIRSKYINVEGIILINGDYNGYCFNYNLNNNYINECNIIKNGKRYTFTFIGSNYFTKEKIQSLLNTIVIE